MASALLGAAVCGVPSVVLAWLAERENHAFLDDLSSYTAWISAPGALLGAGLGALIGRGSARGAILGLMLATVEIGVLDGLTGTLARPSTVPVLLALEVDGLGPGDLHKPDLMPELERLAAAGASGVLIADLPLRPAAVQATLESGRPLAHHGVHGWTGQQEPSRAAGLLQIAEHEGLLVQVGLSEEPGDLPALWTFSGIKAEVVAGTRWTTLRDLGRVALLDRTQPLPPLERHLAREVLAARRTGEAFLHRLALSPPDLALLHIDSVDAVAHLRAGVAASPTDGARPSIDALLGQLRQAVGEQTWVVLWSGWSVNAAGVHQPEGVLVICGPGVAAGSALGEVRAMDLAPTLLGLLDLPAGEDMKGKARFGTATAPVPTWDALAPGAPKEGDEAAANSAALRGLGYAE